MPEHARKYIRSTFVAALALAAAAVQLRNRDA